MSDWPFGDLEQGAYDAICMDVPWNFKVRSDKGMGRSAERHYRTMSLHEISELPVRMLAKRDAFLMFWTTSPFLEKSFPIIKGYGFKYSSKFATWMKLKRSHQMGQLRLTGTIESDFHLGMGFTTRKNGEDCLLAKVGTPKRHSKNVRELILSPLREHSRKPDEFRHRVDEFIGPGKRVAELFARSGHVSLNGNQWDSWGDEINKFREEAVAA